MYSKIKGAVRVKPIGVTFSNWPASVCHLKYLRQNYSSNEQVAFDDNGDRIYAEYEVINTGEDKKNTVVGRFFYNEVI